jgi:hypothetical protein
MSNERNAFEAWYERTYGVRAFAQNVDHSYAEELTEMQWAGWQARAAAPKAEPMQGPVAWLWEMHGWLVTAHGKHRAIKRHVDTSRPPESTVNSDDFIRLVPLCAAPQPSDDVARDAARWRHYRKRYVYPAEAEAVIDAEIDAVMGSKGDE